MAGAALGLFFFGFGVHLTIQANIGVGPWDALHLGLANTLHVKYGTASIAMSLLILGIDVLLKGRIGIGMFLDALIVGKTVDLFDWLGIVPEMTGKFSGVLLMLAGLIVEGFSLYLYMRAGLGCGPRDTLLVQLKKKMRKIPIGLISILILSVVTFAGWKLGGPVHFGTLICALGTGPIMQAAFRVVHFKAEDVTHQDLVTSLMILTDRA
ncbi:MAG: hypothetical protein IJK89_02950 [Clostridia bacterium]|nr:hypothetical protein [Clostridia bacterium]